MVWARWLGWFYVMSPAAQFSERSKVAAGLSAWQKVVKRDQRPVTVKVPDGPMEFVKFAKTKFVDARGIWSAPANFLEGRLLEEAPSPPADLAVAVEELSRALVLAGDARDVHLREHTFFEVTGAYPERSHVVTGSHIWRSATKVDVVIYRGCHVDVAGAFVDLDVSSAEEATIDILPLCTVLGLRHLHFWGSVAWSQPHVGISGAVRQALQDVTAMRPAPVLQGEIGENLAVVGEQDAHGRLDDFLNTLLRMRAISQDDKFVTLGPTAEFNYQQDSKTKPMVFYRLLQMLGRTLTYILCTIL